MIMKVIPKDDKVVIINGDAVITEIPGKMAYHDRDTITVLHDENHMRTYNDHGELLKDTFIAQKNCEDDFVR